MFSSNTTIGNWFGADYFLIKYKTALIVIFEPLSVRGKVIIDEIGNQCILMRLILWKLILAYLRLSQDSQFNKFYMFPLPSLEFCCSYLLTRIIFGKIIVLKFDVHNNMFDSWNSKLEVPIMAIHDQSYFFTLCSLMIFELVLRMMALLFQGYFQTLSFFTVSLFIVIYSWSSGYLYLVS